jgi:hypothetical protein
LPSAHGHEAPIFISWLPKSGLALYETKMLVFVFYETKLSYIADRTAATCPIITTITLKPKKRSKAIFVVRKAWSQRWYTHRRYPHKNLIILVSWGPSPTLVPCCCAWYHNFVFYKTNVFIIRFLHNEISA